MIKKHKRRFFLFTFLIQLFIVFFCGFSVATVTADGGNLSQEANDHLQENVEDLLNKMDLEELEQYLRSLGLTSDEPLAKKLLSFIKGGDFNFGNFIEKLFQVLLDNVKELLPAFSCITGIALMSGVLSTLQSGGAKSTGEVIFIVCYIGTLLPLFIVIGECFQSSLVCINALKTQMQIIYPLLLTLLAASGGNVTASVCRPAVAFFSNSIVAVMTGVVIPLTVLIVLFSMSANITKELKINKFCAFFKSINKWIIGLCVSVFGIFFTLQGITAATYDGITRRATKYAIGNGVPIIGGFLSGGFDLAVAGSALIKNALGNMSIFLMIFILLEPVILLISVNLALRFTAAITQPFGDSRISDFLGETAENLHYCTASLLFTAFLYFLSVLILVIGVESVI